MYGLVLANSTLVPQGEVRNFGGFQFTRAISKLAIAKFRVRLDNDLANSLASAERYIKVYRSGALVLFGPIISAEEVADRSEQTIEVTCADMGWFLTRRLAGKSASGHLFTVATGRAAIAKTLIDTANSESDTRLSTASYAHTAGSSITYKAGPYRPVLECVQELAGALDGFDWRVHPIENWVNGASITTNAGAIEMKTVIGAAKPNAVFEYGPATRANVLSYGKTRTRDQQANRVFHLRDGSNVVTGNNAAAQAAWDLMEDVAAGDITDGTFRQKLVDEHVAVRGYPRDLVRMTPHIDPGTAGHVPQPFVDYDIGDTITFRSVVNGQVRFAGSLRVYGITINVDQETGFERVTLLLEDEA
jgi:hypothetical protein